MQIIKGKIFQPNIFINLKLLTYLLVLVHSITKGYIPVSDKWPTQQQDVIIHHPFLGINLVMELEKIRNVRLSIYILKWIKNSSARTITIKKNPYLFDVKP